MSDLIHGTSSSNGTSAAPDHRAVPESLLYEQSVPGRVGYALPALDVPAGETAALLPGVALRPTLPLPEVSELQVIRHFIKLSQRNHAIDVGFYPLGSCTMKYNPKINEEDRKSVV